MNSTCKFVATIGSVAAVVSTLALAPSASAAPTPKTSTSSAQGVTLKLPSAPTSGSQKVTARNAGGDLDRQSTTSSSAPGPNVVSVGVVAGTAVAKRGGVSYACAGVVQPGGTVSLGGDAARCTAKGPGARGIRVDLGALTGMQLPAGVGDADLYFNAVTAFATQTGQATSGLGKPVNTRLIVCPGVSTNGECSVRTVRVPLVVSRTPNENLLPALLAGLRASSLGPLGTTLANALAPVLRLRANVQTTTNGAFKVVGVQIASAGAAASLNLAIATTGPNS